MNCLTTSESGLIYDIGMRLGKNPSPVLRMQAIMQFSQAVDMLALGDTSREKINELWKENDRLQNELNALQSDDDELDN